MAFETIEKTTIREKPVIRTLRVGINRTGGIYIGTAIVAKFPLTEQHNSAELYFDADTDQVAIEPKEYNTGRFHFIKQAGARVIYCAGFLNAFRIVRGQVLMAEIKDINGSRMIVFKVNREKAADDE